MRRRKQNQRSDAIKCPVPKEGQPVYIEIVENPQEVKKGKKHAKMFQPFRLLESITQNPEVSTKLLLIFFALAGDNLRMDRRIDTVATSIDKVRNVTEVVQTAMQSLKTAAEAPNHIRRLFQ